MASEFVCSDCGSDLTTDDFISAVCGACGGYNPITRSDYETADLGNTKLIDSEGVDGIVITPECGPMGGWIQCRNPYPVRE